MPFYYYKASDLDHLEKMSFLITHSKTSETLAKHIAGYDKIISEFKTRNPQSYIKLKQTKQGIFKDVMRNAVNN